MALNYSKILGVQGGANVGNVALNTAQSLQGLGMNQQAQEQSAIEFEQQQQQRKQAQQQQEQIIGLRKRAFEGDKSAMADLFSFDPAAVQKLEERQANKNSQMNAESLIASRRKETDFGLRWQTADDTTKLAMLEEAKADDLIYLGEDESAVTIENAEIGVNAMLYSHLGDKGYKQLIAKDSEKQKALPAETVAFNDLIKDFTPEQQVTAKKIKAGLKGRAVSNAVLSAIESGDIRNLAQAKAEIRQTEKFAEATATSRARTIDNGFQTISKIDASVRNIDRAVKAIKGGAGVGVLEKMWPSIKAASVELDNIRSSMALDVVGATTFGALSAGELALAKDVALPTGLDTDELLVYLRDRKSAQQKLRDYYNEQIQFLDQGGTVAGFLREKERGSQQSTADQALSMDNQAMEWAQANPNDPRAAAIMQKLQGK